MTKKKNTEAETETKNKKTISNQLVSCCLL